MGWEDNSVTEFRNSLASPDLRATWIWVSGPVLLSPGFRVNINNALMNFSVNAVIKETNVKTQINKTFNVPRKNTLYYQHKKSNNCTVFVTTYNPSLPNFNNIIKKYYPILTASDRCKNAFKDLPLLAYRHPRNLRDTLVRAKAKTPQSSPSSPPKITHCNDSQCKTCKFIAHNTTSYTFHNNGQTRTIHQNLSCSSDNLIYMVYSQK